MAPAQNAWSYAAPHSSVASISIARHCIALPVWWRVSQQLHHHRSYHEELLRENSGIKYFESVSLFLPSVRGNVRCEPAADRITLRRLMACMQLSLVCLLSNWFLALINGESSSLQLVTTLVLKPRLVTVTFNKNIAEWVLPASWPASFLLCWRFGLVYLRGTHIIRNAWCDVWPG